MLVSHAGAERPDIRVVGYGPGQFDDRVVHGTGEIRPLLDVSPVVWVNVNGLADIGVIQEIGNLFGLHRLALEDAVNVHQRPKVEEYDNYTFIVSRLPQKAETLETEQVSMFLGDGMLITFQEGPKDCFEPVRARLRQGKGRIRTQGADYLAYALIDAAIDSYFPVLETYGERVENLEAAVLRQPDSSLVAALHDIKRDLLTLRRAIWPQREMVNALVRDGSAFVSDSTRPYLRDCYDHCIQLMDMVETFRELASGLVDLYISTVGNRTNEIMKVLTVIATIFIPLSFIAGLYGMNFDGSASPWNMPELRWKYGYFFALGLMLVTALGLLGYFIRRGWVGWPRPAIRGGNRDGESE